MPPVNALNRDVAAQAAAPGEARGAREDPVAGAPADVEQPALFDQRQALVELAEITRTCRDERPQPHDTEFIQPDDDAPVDEIVIETFDRVDRRALLRRRPSTVVRTSG